MMCCNDGRQCKGCCITPNCSTNYNEHCFLCVQDCNSPAVVNSDEDDVRSELGLSEQRVDLDSADVRSFQNMRLVIEADGVKWV